MKPIRVRAKTTLLHAGVNPAHTGFEIISDCIAACYADEEFLHKLQGKLYVEVGKARGITPSSVERNIRHAVESACLDQETVCSVLNFPKSAFKNRKVTNKAFIAACVQKLKMEDEEEREQLDNDSWSADC